MNKPQEVLEEVKEANSFKSRVGRAMKDKNDASAEFDDGGSE